MINNEDVKNFYSQLDALYAAGNQMEIEQFLIDKANEYKPEIIEESGLYVAVLNELGSYYRGISQFELSKQVFSAAEYMLFLYPGAESIEYANLLINVAGTYRLNGEYSESLEMYSRALEILESKNMQNSYFYASALNNMGLTCQANKEYEKGIEYSLKALSILENNPKYFQQTATTYSNLAILYNLTGDQEAYKDSLYKAVEIFEKLSDDKDPHYAAALNNLAAYCYSEKNYSKAKELYKKIIDMVKHSFGENADYATACKSISKTYEALGDYKMAIRYLEIACDIFKKIYGDTSEKYNESLVALVDLRAQAKYS